MRLGAPDQFKTTWEILKLRFITGYENWARRVRESENSASAAWRRQRNPDQTIGLAVQGWPLGRREQPILHPPGRRTHRRNQLMTVRGMQKETSVAAMPAGQGSLFRAKARFSRPRAARNELERRARLLHTVSCKNISRPRYTKR